MVAVPRVAEWQLLVDLIMVAAAITALGQVAGTLEVGDDLSCRSLRDPDGLGDIAEAGRRIARDHLEGVGVVRYESERVVLFAGNKTHVTCYYSSTTGSTNHSRS